MARRSIRRGGQKDINDLVAAIIAQARFEWQAPSREDYRSVCWGDEVLGFEPCIFRWECYPSGGIGKGQRYRECLWRRSALKQELLKFFFSPWFEFLCGGIDPHLARQAIGVPEYARK